MKDVFLTAGAGSPTLDAISYSNEAPVPDDPQGKITAQQESAASVIETMATVIGAIETAVGMIMALLGADTTKKSLAILAMQTVAKVISMSVKEAKELEGEIHTYSQGSTTMNSMKEVTMSGVQGVGMSSPMYASVVGGVEAGMTGLISASVTGGMLLGLTGGVEASLLGGKKAGISARRGEVEVVGSGVSIGAAKPAFPQAATATIEMAATKDIKAAVEGAAGTDASLAMTNSGITLDAETIGIMAKTSVASNVGATSVSIGTDGAALAHSLNSAARLALKAANDAYALAKKAADEAHAAAKVTNATLAPDARNAAFVAARQVHRDALKAAQTTLKTETDLQRKLKAAVLRVGVTSSEAEVTNGLSKISVDNLGKITIDAGAMPLILKSGASSIEITPASIKVTSPSIVEG